MRVLQEAGIHPNMTCFMTQITQYSPDLSPEWSRTTTLEGDLDAGAAGGREIPKYDVLYYVNHPKLVHFVTRMERLLT
jgi:hypothetical protein